MCVCEATSLKAFNNFEDEPFTIEQAAHCPFQKEGRFFSPSLSVRAPLLIEGKSFSSYINLTKRSVKFLIWTPPSQQSQLCQHRQF